MYSEQPSASTSTEAPPDGSLSAWRATVVEGCVAADVDFGLVEELHAASKTPLSSTAVQRLVLNPKIPRA
jgi:hypothetical protein